MLDRIAALANSSPNGNFIIILGIENIVGRDKTFPKVLVKAVFVVGLGDTAFTGPVIDLSVLFLQTLNMMLMETGFSVHLQEMLQYYKLHLSLILEKDRI